MYRNVPLPPHPRAFATLISFLATHRAARIRLFGLFLGLGAATACAPLHPTSSVARRSTIDSAAHAAIVNERSVDASQFDHRTVAVVPLNVNVSDTTLSVLGVGLADLLTTDLAQSAQLRVVERLHLDAIMRELQLAASGLVDSVSAPRVGRLVGARRVVVGDIAQLASGALQLSTRVADTQTADVVGGAERTTTVDGLLDAEKALAFGVIEGLGVALTPAERARIEQRPTGSIAALLAYSRGVRAEAQGDFRRAASHFRAAVRIDPGFQGARTRASSADALAVSIEIAGPVPAQRPLDNVASLSADAINRPSVPPVADVATAPFTATAKTATVIITVRVP